MIKWCLLTWVLHSSASSKSKADLRSGSDGQNISASSAGESALVASTVGTNIDIGIVTDVCSWIGRHLDWVVSSGAGGTADVLVWRSGGTVDDIDVKPVVSRCHLGNGADDDSTSDLHCGDVWNNQVNSRPGL